MPTGARFDQLKDLLEAKADQYNRPEFIAEDPVSIPHRFSRLQDREIAGLFAAVLAWGQRKTIIANCLRLLERMDNDPYRFVLHHADTDLVKLESFVHRTFNSTDLLYFIHFLKSHYQQHSSLEELFVIDKTDPTVEGGLVHFHESFFSLPESPSRTRKHIATPARKSACKRMNMYLRWMVRSDGRGVDFGLWKRIAPSQLVTPVDVHVERVARRLKLIGKGPLNWQKAVELTAQLRKFDPADPVRFDFALFGLGLEDKR